MTLVSTLRRVRFARQRGVAGVLHRPAFLPAPAWALRTIFGQMADEALLASTRVSPQRLDEAGFSFRYSALDDALRAAVEPGQV